MYNVIFVVRSRNHCCYGNTTVPSLLIIHGVDVAVSNVKVFSVAMECNNGFLRKIFRTDLNNRTG